MSMTAAEIAGVVGTKYKPWFPSLVYSDSDVNYPHYIDEATGRRVSDDIAELAFIGTAVRELKQHSIQPVEIARYVGEGSVDFWQVGWANGWDDKNKKGPTLLHALVAALNESEGA